MIGPPVWRIAINTKLGDVYHLATERSPAPTAWCSRNIVLDPRSGTTEPGTKQSPGAVCGRCSRIIVTFRD